MNSNEIKQIICDFIKNNPGCVKKLWDLPNSIDETELCNPRVWKRNLKEKCDEGIVRYFDPRLSKNEEVVDQVYAEIITDSTDTLILSIKIEG